MPYNGRFWRIFRGWFAAVLLLLASPVAARPPAEQLALLQRGVSITGWFRYPGSRAPEALAGWMSDAAMADLRAAGFTFVRLAVDPVVVAEPAARAVAVAAVCRLQRQGLAVVLDAHPVSWHLEDRPDDRLRLIGFWRDMAPALRQCDPRRVFPELLNEPVFTGAPGAWAGLQQGLLRVVRAALPDSTIVLTGHDWGSIAGLQALAPEADPNVVYSVHFYDPSDLTSLAAWRPGPDRAALARLPFPVDDAALCQAAADAAADAATAGFMRYYCASGWNAAAIGLRVEAAASWARQHDAAVLVGEFGASNALNEAARLAWLRTARAAFEAAGFGWSLWGYDDSMGFDVGRPPRRPVLDRNIMAALGLMPLSRK